MTKHTQQTSHLTNRKRLAWLAVATLITLACLFAWQGYHGGKAKPASARQELSTTLHLGWIYSGSYAGDALAQMTLGPRNGLRLKIVEGGIGLDPLKLVEDGNFGIASSDDLLKAIDKGAPFVIIGLATEDSPVAFVSLKDKNITSPADFSGKRIGLLPFGSTGLVYRALLKANNIDRSRLTEITVTPDLKAFLVGNTHDVQPIYDYDESVTLDSANVKYSVVRPKDWGVKYKGAAYFTTVNTVKERPELVERFVISIIDGWKEAESDPGAAIAALKQLSPKLDVTRETEVLKRGLPYFISATRKPLTTDPKSWTQMNSNLLEFGELRKPVDLNRALDLRFVDKAYAK